MRWTDHKNGTPSEARRPRLVQYKTFITVLTRWLSHVSSVDGWELASLKQDKSRDVTIQLFWIHDSIQIQTKCLDSIQIQFFKMLIASKLNSRFNSTINFHLNSVHNSIQLSKLHFKSIHNSIPLNSGHWCLGILYYLYSWR